MPQAPMCQAFSLIKIMIWESFKSKKNTRLYLGKIRNQKKMLVPNRGELEIKKRSLSPSGKCSKQKCRAFPGFGKA
jgi:hypothetical protein